MSQRLMERLSLQATRNFVGRTEEIAHLLYILNEQKTPVVFVHGIGGIGKSSLLEAFVAHVQAQGVVVIKLECRSIKPSTEGFLQGLAAAIGGDATDLEQLALRLSRLGERVILMFDTYEVFRMMDAWLRHVFIPALNDNVQIVFFGREAPVSAWYTASGWNGMFQSILLGPLSNSEAEALLLQCGVPETDTRRVTLFTHGHPLALKLAAATIAERPNLNLKEVESQHVVTELIKLYMSDVSDPVSRLALEAASVVRRTTHSLLGAILPDIAPNDAYNRLQVIPFVDSASDGLMIHDLVQQAIATHLRAADPERYHNYRLAAWRQLRSEFSAGSRPTIWRYTADMAYLIDHPAIHEALFPSDVHLYAIEPATPADEPIIRSTTLRHDGPETLRIVQHWWALTPGFFNIARGRQMEVNGFYCLLPVQPAVTRLQFDDPITRLYWQHLQANPIPERQLALLSVKILAVETGDVPSAVQAALWLDIKRCYLEYAQARRVYTNILTKSWIPVLEQFGFRCFDAVTLDGKEYITMVNDFGPQLVPGWMAGLIDTQLGLVRSTALNVEARELIVGDTHIGLTPLEFSLIKYLSEHEGKAVSRDELLNAVWGYDYDGGSNVVDVIIRSLRKKLGEHAKFIETVAGVGYRLRWAG
jgi:hypothetical protein